MTREQWGYTLWGALFLFFAIPELLAAILGKHVPWPTLSETVGNLIGDTNGWAAIAIVGGMAILLVHLVLPDAFNPRKKKQKP
jgi:hypothetical protein